MERALRWVFADRTTGAIVLAQMPNQTLWTFIVAWAAGFVVSPGLAIAAALRVVSGVSLAIWALDEVLRGVNPWRRCLGAAVLVYEAKLFL